MAISSQNYWSCNQHYSCTGWALSPAHPPLLVNPRRACAARVTVLGLSVSWGAIFSVKGGKGGGGGGGGEEKGERKEVVNGRSGEGN